ncbi:hypothetical protein AZE42_13827 [Rhizopogon vesiculosus]|uniref:Uncharacterized protein n=1 Tax=Rhizopogon vesiculosus TaxID=180088 RepID=A0A1J8R9Y5_9AGAM|nr:hypothetical protein AZE42_13827 [Rhizopogon vesiculosus]
MESSYKALHRTPRTKRILPLGFIDLEAGR